MSVVVEDIDWSDLSTSVEEEEELTNPDATVVEAIAGRNAVLLQRALDAGGSIKQKVGKEKLALFAFKNFDPDVIQALVKAGVSFKDISNLNESALFMDNGPALAWLSKTKPWLQAMESTSEANLLVRNAIQQGCLECLKVLQDTGLFASSDEVMPAHVQSGFWAALRTKGVEQIIEFCAFSPIQKHVRRAVIEGLSRSAYTEGFTVGQLQRLQQVLQHPRLEKQLKELFPLLLKDGYAYSLGSLYKKFVADTGIQFPGKHSYSMDLPNVYAQNFTQWVILRGSVACQALAQHEKGRDIIAKTLNNKENIVNFIAYASKNTLAKVIKRVPELHAWRDEKGNSIFHYAMYLNEPSASFAQEVFSSNKTISMETNDLGNAPMKHISREAMSKIEKSLMKNAVKDNVKSKSAVVKRKM